MQHGEIGDMSKLNQKAINLISRVWQQMRDMTRVSKIEIDFNLSFMK